MKNTEVKSLIKFLSVKYGLTQAHMEDIISAPFDLLAEVLHEKADSNELYFPAVRIPFFGIFYVPSYKIERFKKGREERAKLNNNGITDISRENKENI